MTTLLVDVRTIAHNAIAQTWRPIAPNDATPETAPEEWARLISAAGNIRRHLDDLEELAYTALIELGYELEITPTGATLSPST